VHTTVGEGLRVNPSHRKVAKNRWKRGKKLERQNYQIAELFLFVKKGWVRKDSHGQWDESFAG